MVLLTYQNDLLIRGSAKLDKDSVSRGELPKTPYIDKLYAFNECYADEERCDLFFICQDGEIPAHRLVISNASKYIMAMQDELPSWYPVYISVPDLTKEIVNTLVRLAYTGQMILPPGITSDEVVDAMQALGWVNTDCLTATYLDSSSAGSEDDLGSFVSSKTAESLETVLKMKFPVSAKGEADTSDDDEGMGVTLPDIPMADDDEGNLEIVTDVKKLTPKKGTRKTKQKKPNKPSPSPSKTNNTRSRQSPKPIANLNKQNDASSSTRKGNRKNNDETVDSTTTASEDAQAETTTVENDAEPLRSRTRTIRKPKKFDDDMIVMTPTKRKESPTKSPSKPPPKRSQLNEAESETKKAAKAPKKDVGGSKASNDAKPNTAGVGKANRRSTSSENKESIRNSLITSYFNKKSPSRKSNDISTADEDDANEVTEKNNVQKTDESNGDGGDSPGEGEPLADSSTDTAKGTTSLRNRARSTTSSKGDKEAAQEEDKDNDDSENPVKNRRKRNNQDTSEPEVDFSNPVKRGRKASTVSNASKASSKGK